ncbi:MAG TPA: T9SS type A sorting domain-containing protein [Bacteroidia bacterium]|nr:T9SS type A sorting domain-containing protein [Bacteroidia bacterium]
MRKLITLRLLLALCAMPITTFAQWKNNVWMWGAWPNDTTWAYRGITKLIFDSNSLNYFKDSLNKINISGTYTGLSTPDNNYFIYSNGYTVANKNHDTLLYGTGLSPGGTYSNWSAIGNPTPYSAVLLPMPGSDTFMALIHTDNFNTGTYHAENVYMSIIDPIFNNNQGAVTIKNQLVANDSFNIGALLVNRHANGRDWWILLKRNYQNDFFTFLLTPLGVELKQIQAMGGPIARFGGQGVFSPNGKIMAGFNNGYQLRIYDFNRCSGELSNMRYKYITPETGGGTAFSPNSRYLYICKWDSLWQFDMQAPDIMASQTFIDKIDTTFADPATGFISGWCYMYLGADGKIYVQNFSGVMLNVINNPDMPSQACNFVQNQIQCPTYYYATVPTYVNLNLMQEPGSICDTLGVGNEKLNIKNSALKIAPNPSNGNISIEFPVQEISGILYVYDVNGKLVYSDYVSPYTYIKNINLQGKLSSGMYALSMVFGEERFLGKMVVE